MSVSGDSIPYPIANLEADPFYWSFPLCPSPILKQVWPSTGLACIHASCCSIQHWLREEYRLYHYASMPYLLLDIS